MNIINIHDFNLSYDSVQLFKNFNFSVEKGKSVGVFGPTGTGKTSLLNKIIEDYISKYKIAYVFQDNKLLENFSVKKNIILPLKNIFPKEECDKKVADILDFVNLKNMEDKKVSVLSGGEHQRVNIARAFAYVSAAKCNILLMDEPFSAQDDVNRENLINLTKKIATENNVTTVVVSHNRDDLDKLCDYVIDL